MIQWKKHFVKRMLKMSLTKRNPAADLIRILAFFSVVSVHFFLNNGFYSYPIEGRRMYIMMLMRSFFIICVPLFMTLSGYLLGRKQLEKSYYKRISKIIITYILASLLCVLYSVVYLKQNLSIKNIVANILSFSAAPYSWYIEMYLGLFLLIPFLNIVYNALPSQKWKIWLILTFVILTSLPSVINIYDLSSLDWWALPSSSSTMNKIVPDWWQSMYPITYYYLGCYLREYGLKLKKGLNGILIILWTIFSGTFCYWRSYKTTFIWGAWCSYQSLFNVILTLLVFTFVMNTNFDKLPNGLAKFIQKVSGLCLGGYLVSWIFDNELYPKLLTKVPSVTHRLEYYFVIVPVVFVLSLVASYVLSKIQFLIEKSSLFIYKLIRKKFTKTIQTS